LVTSLEAEVQRLDSRTLAERTEPYLRGSVIPESTRITVDDAFTRAHSNWEERASAKFDTAPADLETFLADPEHFMFETGAMEDSRVMDLVLCRPRTNPPVVDRASRPA
jgi:hypothetical protein